MRTSHIRTAVEPLKADAVQKAEDWAKNEVEEMWNELLENDLDIDKAAPYPKSCWDCDYRKKSARHKRFSYCFGTGYRKPAKKNEEMIERFVNGCKEDAASQYEKFIYKLESKCGEVDSALLEGNHVWGHSFLTVENGDEKQVWKTQMIINYSKHGKAFNQFPTRKVKQKA